MNPKEVKTTDDYIELVVLDEESAAKIDEYENCKESVMFIFVISTAIAVGSELPLNYVF